MDVSRVRERVRFERQRGGRERSLVRESSRDREVVERGR